MGPLPSGKRLHNYGKKHHFSWENPLSLTMFNSYVSLPEGNSIDRSGFVCADNLASDNAHLSIFA